MRTEKKVLMIIIVLTMVSSGLSGQSVQGGQDGEHELNSDAFRLSFAIDLPVIAGGAALLATEFLVSPATGEQQNVDELFFLDSLSINPYNAGIDTACEYILGVSLLMPAVIFIGADFESAVEVGVMFLETLLWTYAAKDLAKDLVPRYRPYTYVAEPVDDDYMNSFPSGHTAALFAVSGFTSVVFAEMYPDSIWKIPVIAGSYSVAVTMGVLRVVSGNHFVTDVLAGALLGTIIGIGIPMLHSIDPAGDSGVEVTAGFDDAPALTLSYRL